MKEQSHFYDSLYKKKQTVRDKKTSFYKKDDEHFENKNINFDAKIEKTQKLFGTLDKESLDILENFDDIIQNVKPMNQRQKKELPHIIRDLSHELTDERSERRLGYMNESQKLFAYINYYMWWNLYRLTSLFAAMDASCFAFLKDDSVLLDMGSGPLTVVIALWLSRPELRKKKLKFYCCDVSSSSLSLGENLFLSIASKTIHNDKAEPWKITRIKGSFGVSIKEKADFIFCANMFNELYWDTDKPLEEVSKKYSASLSDYAGENASFFIVEPGIPRAARFITLLKECFTRRGFNIILPCPYEAKCAMPGLKGGKWCHFVLSTENAPKKLRYLSEQAHLSKDRASLSFVFASKKLESIKDESIRIISDSIKLENEKTYARYACSSQGLTLVCGKVKKLESGCSILLNKKLDELTLKNDKKTSAKMIFVDN